MLHVLRDISGTDRMLHMLREIREPKKKRESRVACSMRSVPEMSRSTCSMDFRCYMHVAHVACEIRAL